MKKKCTLILALHLMLPILAVKMPMLAEDDADKYPNPDNPITLSLFADYTWLDFDRVDGIVPQLITEETGITFDFTKATDTQQLTMMLTSGEIPDLISTGSSSKLYQMSHPSLLYSYNELIEEYAPDWEIPEVEQKVNAAYSEDGNIYFLRNNFNTVQEMEGVGTIGLNYGQFHMRGDIYEALGSPALDTVEDFFALMHQVKEEYPDMIPMVINTGYYQAYAQLVGLDMGKPTNADGNFSHYIQDPLYKEYLRLINRTYREGLMTDENFAFTSSEQTNQFIANGQAFLTTFYAGNDEQVFTSYVSATDPDAYFIQVPIFDDFNRTFSVTGYAGVGISRNTQYPEEAIKLIRWAKDNQLKMMLGVEGVDWELNEDGTVSNLERMQKALEQGTVETTYNPMTFVLSAADFITESRARFYSSATPETRLIQDEVAARAKYSNVTSLAYPPSDSDEGVIGQNLSSLVDEYFPILGMAADDAEFDAHYENFMQEAEAIGVQEYSDYLKTRFDEISADFDSY